jgi:hypothetical protein
MSEDEVLRHLRKAFVLLWRNECAFASACGQGEAKLSPVLVTILAAIRELAGDPAVSATMVEAENVGKEC